MAHVGHVEQNSFSREITYSRNIRAYVIDRRENLRVDTRAAKWRIRFAARQSDAARRAPRSWRAWGAARPARRRTPRDSRLTSRRAQPSGVPAATVRRRFRSRVATRSALRQAGRLGWLAGWQQYIYAATGRAVVSAAARVRELQRGRERAKREEARRVEARARGTRGWWCGHTGASAVD